MMMTAELIATLSSGLFTGAALYINLVEHPARLSCGTAAALMEWRPSYQRATVMQAPLAVIGTVAGLAAWFMGAGQMWVIGAVLMAAIIPFTLVVIFPTNAFLLSPAAEVDLPSATASLVRWNRLHAVRTVLSAGAFLLFLVLLGG